MTILLLKSFIILQPETSIKMAINASDVVDIPVIDISASNAQAASELVEAAAKYGFVFVKNNDAGIAPKEVADMFNLVFSYLVALCKFLSHTM